MRYINELIQALLEEEREHFEAFCDDRGIDPDDEDVTSDFNQMRTTTYVTEQEVLDAPVGSLFLRIYVASSYMTLWLKQSPTTAIIVATSSPFETEGIVWNITCTSMPALMMDVTADFQSNPEAGINLVTELDTEPPCHCNRADFLHNPGCAYVAWLQQQRSVT